MSQPNHLITVSYRPTSPVPWDYSIRPKGAGKHARIKRGQTVAWTTKEGDNWTLEFYNNKTPLEDENTGAPLLTISGQSNGTPVGGIISQKPKPDDAFPYSFTIDAGSQSASDDPEIIIETDFRKLRKTKKAKSTPAKKAKKTKSKK